MFGSIIRQFNKEALEEKNKMQAKNGKPPVTRLQGRDETLLYLKFISKYFKKADEAKASISSEKLKGITQQMGSLKNEASTAEIGKKLNKFGKSLSKEPKQVKAELATRKVKVL